MSRIRLKVPDAPPDKNRSRPVKSDNITLADFKYQAIQPIPTLFVWYVRCGAIGYEDAEGYFYILAILFGAAAGNVARGVPLDANGNFSMAFFTNFDVRGYVGLLDWYTVSVAIFATVILAAHGATYLTLKTEGPVHDRSAICANYICVAVAPLVLAISVETWVVRPDLIGPAIYNPFWWVGLIMIIVSTLAIISGLLTRRERRAFVGSNFLIVGLLITGAAAIFPVMLYSTLAPENSLTAYGVASNRSSLLIASIWWPVGFALTTAYFIFISRRFAGKISVTRDTQGSY